MTKASSKNIDGGAERLKKKKPPAKPAKQPRKPNDGPVMHTYRQFMAKCKGLGFSHSKSLKKWKKSEERAELIGNMSESERKRRRF